MEQKEFQIKYAMLDNFLSIQTDNQILLSIKVDNISGYDLEDLIGSTIVQYLMREYPANFKTYVRNKNRSILARNPE